MPANVVQAQYEQLQAISQRFHQSAETVNEIQQRLKSSYTQLAEGGWQGQGSTAFRAEMDGTVFPVLQRLNGALAEARGTTLAIAEVLNGAEAEAAALFRGQGDGPQSNATPVNAFMGASPTAAAMASGGDSWWDWLFGKTPTDPDVPPPPIPEPTPPPIPAMEPATPKPAQTGPVTHAEGAAKLKEAGIPIISSGNCSDASKKNCTSLDGMHSNTVDRLIEFKQQSGIAVTVTGGTEVGHSKGEYSHSTGYKVDIKATTEADQYIKENYKYIGRRKSDNAEQYQDANGNIYARETKPPHWDILYTK